MADPATGIHNTKYGINTRCIITLCSSLYIELLVIASSLGYLKLDCIISSQFVCHRPSVVLRLFAKSGADATLPCTCPAAQQELLRS